jgi:phosphatidylethanolamine-binding protein (PEBP) family uncharacterized protein
MKKNLFGIVALLTVLPAMSLVLPGCDTGTAGGITVPVFTVTSSSINSTTGKLLTATASVTASPKGSNQSPQLSWDAVPDAACYAIFMVDESAGHWLHWRAIIANKTSLVQGESISGAQYEGPYPPDNNDHNYRIEVFALKQDPGTAIAAIGIFNYENNYTNMVNQLNAIGGGDNIIARGHIIGKYKNGDTNL